jgi:hypothetical protein
MFMVEENNIQKERLDTIYKRVKAVYGTLPPQMEFLGSIDALYLEEFLKSILRVMKHPHIELDIFAFIRLHIAFKEGYAYCQMFNSKLLLSKGYTQKLLDEVIENIANIPFEAKDKALAEFAIKAIYESKSCKREDFELLYAMGWSQKDVFDAIEHAGTIFRNGRILVAYGIKD